LPFLRFTDVSAPAVAGGRGRHRPPLFLPFLSFSAFPS
jgi:hypothetical protein